MIVSEYVDVANAFVDRDETGMVNAVLDMLARNVRADELDQKTGMIRWSPDCGPSGCENGSPDMQSGEDKLIARYFKPLATAPGALSLTDDAAFFAPPSGYEVVLKTDAIVAGVHFLPDDPPDGIARKALRVNLSDLPPRARSRPAV